MSNRLSEMSTYVIGMIFFHSLYNFHTLKFHHTYLLRSKIFEKIERKNDISKRQLKGMLINRMKRSKFASEINQSTFIAGYFYNIFIDVVIVYHNNFKNIDYCFTILSIIGPCVFVWKVNAEFYRMLLRNELTFVYNSWLRFTSFPTEGVPNGFIVIPQPYQIYSQKTNE